MTTGDLLGLILSYVYAFSLLFIVEAIRRRRNYSTDFTRKIIHIGAGMWIWAILLLFDHWWLAIIPTGTFIIFNALFLRFHVFSAMDPKEGATPGAAYFACLLLYSAPANLSSWVGARFSQGVCILRDGRHHGDDLGRCLGLHHRKAFWQAQLFRARKRRP